jgi:hypothetical protein
MSDQEPERKLETEEDFNRHREYFARKRARDKQARVAKAQFKGPQETA